MERFEGTGLMSRNGNEWSGGADFTTPGDIYNAMPPRIVFGAGAAARVAEEVARLNAGRALVVCTPGRNEMAHRVADRLGGLCVGVYPKAVSQVPIELARAARAYVTECGIDCLIAVGGGAAIGLAKAVALETDCSYIAVPSTYSGSEMTGFCGITIDGVKRMHTSLRMLARTVIYDPELTLGLPVQVSAESAMNAMAHCIEALYVRTASPVIAMAALEGIRALSEGVPRVMRDPADLQARREALYGAYLGGAALTGGFALHHGVAHVLGASYGIPHATSHSVALPYVTAFNESACPAIMSRVARSLGAETASGGLYDFARSVGAPVCLADQGMTQGDVERCTELVIETDNGLNPRPVDAQGVRLILEAALSGRRPQARMFAA
ncbi:maleylacetate reductase [Castellaniella hirudinis]|uniref:Maleylacetate reductase n=1 Tax=Castellaniella hirudinis TaxID=1144617 RepID=A0ABV8RUW3_9BURK